MERLRIAATECKYQELGRWVKEQFIHDVNDNNTLIEQEAYSYWRQKQSYKHTGPYVGKGSRGLEDTNSSHKQFKSDWGSWCHVVRKAKKKAHLDIVDPSTHLKDALHIGRDMGSVPRWTMLVQSTEAQDK